MSCAQPLGVTTLFAIACSASPSAPSSPSEIDAPSNPSSRGSSASTELSEPLYRYRVRSDEGLERLQVELCTQGDWPARIVSAPAGARGLLSAAAGPWEAQRAPSSLPIRGPRIELAELDEPCLHYEYDLGGGSTGVRRAGASAMLSPDSWLFRPPGRGPLEGSIEMDLGPTWGHSVPWTPLEGGTGEGSLYKLERSVVAWRNHPVIGRFERRRFNAEGSEFELVIADRSSSLSLDGLEQFTRQAARAVATVYDRFPRDRLQIVVWPVPWGRGDAVGFGTLGRGGGSGQGASVLLFVRADAQDDELHDDWVAVHEMMHAGMPFIASEGRWLSEGFTTYYQVVARARVGALPGQGSQEERARQVIRNGLERGERSRLSIGNASIDMHARFAYAKVYWGGAGIALDLDLELRERSDGEHTLDELMKIAWEEIGEPPERVPAQQVVELWSEHIARWGLDFALEPYVEQWLRRDRFPDALWARLEPAAAGAPAAPSSLAAIVSEAGGL